jgi:hypothetical protein
MPKKEIKEEEYGDYSRFPELEVPKFQSTIPRDLLEGKDEVEKLIYNSINIQNQQLNWLIDVSRKNNRQLRITNGRLTKVEH